MHDAEVGVTVMPTLYWDFDGTLVDTLPGIMAAVNALRAHLGLGFADREQVRRWVGGGIDALVDNAAEQAGAASAGLRERYLQIYSGEYLLGAKPFAGIPETLDRLDKFAHVIVTNKSRASTTALLSALGWKDRFLTAVCPEDTGVRKPDPKFLARAARQAGTEGRPALVIGDSEFDLRVGRAAGVATAAALWGYREQTELADEKPDLWLKSPAELTPAVVLRVACGDAALAPA